VGALVPLVPWFFTSGGAALALSLILGALAAVVIGLALARFSARSPLRLVVRQLIVTIAAAGVTFLVGKAVGTNLT
jgi:VIT1/CCC1 family predicted Fe2+/Mn2+ transporter